MIFGTVFFILLIASAGIYWLIAFQQIRNLLLSLVSLGFIGYYDQGAVLLVICLSIWSWLIGHLIESRRPKTLSWLRIGIVGLILVLVLFKYLGLLTTSLNHLLSVFSEQRFHFEKLLLPLGISYIIFKHISYLTDIHWKLTTKGSFLNLLFYSSFFTIFTAGPIERFERFNPQVNTKIAFKAEHFSLGFENIVVGLFKKFVIADWLGFFINPIWENGEDYSIFVRFLALLGYSVQIYMDFAGYSDIAIGSSRLFGIRIMENFKFPYLQPNISQFWRCWHISLSDWIRDYVFFPLSKMSKRKTWLLYIVPIIAMSICGLWHGASWHFMLWGMVHGIYLAVYQYWNNTKKRNSVLLRLSNKTWFNNLSILFTFILVSLAWYLFR
jgi:alginate O-acetyltransferase complex protein AlgI